MGAMRLGVRRGEAAIWTARCAGLGIGLAAVLGAIALGWLAWPALLGGWLGGGALLALLAWRGRRDPAWRGHLARPLAARPAIAPAIRREAA